MIIPYFCSKKKNMFKKIIFILVLFLPLALLGQYITTEKACQENLWKGFGVGSLHQGDMTTAQQLKIADIAGLSMLSVGAIGMVATNIVRNALVAMVGETTQADYYIFGSIMATGLSVVITSRIIGYQKAKKHGIQMAPATSLNGIVLSLHFNL